MLFLNVNLLSLRLPHVGKSKPLSLILTVRNLSPFQPPDRDTAGHVLLNIPYPKLLPPVIEMLAIHL